MTYLLDTIMSSGGLFISGPIIISAVLFLSTESQKKLRSNPNWPILSIGPVKNMIDKVSGTEAQNYGR